MDVSLDIRIQVLSFTSEWKCKIRQAVLDDKQKKYFCATHRGQLMTRRLLISGAKYFLLSTRHTLALTIIFFTRRFLSQCPSLTSFAVTIKGRKKSLSD